MKKVEAFNYLGVKLKDSYWKRQFDNTMLYYLDIPDDNLLYGFRKRAGLPTPGKELHGWYETGIFHNFGQIIGALSKMYASTGNEALKSKVEKLLSGWGKCIEPDGYFFKNSRGLVFDTCYEYEKMTGGLTDAFEYTGNTDALKYLGIITEWMMKNNVNRRSGEWYTLAENVYRAYMLTNDDKYRKFAEEFEYTEYWKLYLDENPQFGVRHAYSHVNSMCSASMAYAVKKEREYFDIIKNAYKLITSKHIYPALGTYGPAEELFRHDGFLGESVLGPLVRPLGLLGNSEVPCVTWAAFKFCRYLIEYTGDLLYGDWVEKLVYNGIGAELPLGPDGMVMYYANYHVYGAYKDYRIDQFCWDNGTTAAWQCCTGTYPQAVTEYHNLIYFKDQDSLYISQYLPSSVQWNKDGTSVNIDMDTKYPEDGRIEIRVDTERPVKFSLKLRVPTWVSKLPQVKVTRSQAIIDQSQKGWIIINNEWQKGDVVILDIPMHLFFSRIDPQHRSIVSLNYGPVVYASLDEGILRGDTSNPHIWIKPTGSDNQQFETIDNHVVGYEKYHKRFVPFYKIGERERYYLYNQVFAEYKR